MRFVADRDTLLAAVAAAGRAAGRETARPALSCVSVTVCDGRLTVVGTDLQTTITADADINDSRNGHVVVPARLLHDVIRSTAAGPVTVTADSDEVHIDQHQTKFGLRLFPADDYPHIDPPCGDPRMIPAGPLVDAVRKVSVAASTDHTNPILCGILLDPVDTGLRLAACDRYRLAVADIPTAGVLAAGRQMLVPARAATEVARHATGDDIAVWVGDRTITFGVGRIRVTTQLIDGTYPPYGTLIPAGARHVATCDRDALADAARQAALIASSEPVRITFQTDQLGVASSAADIGDAAATIDASYDGPETTVGFNARYLLDGLATATTATVTLDIDGTAEGATKPCVIRCDPADGSLYLLMPIRIG